MGYLFISIVDGVSFNGYCYTFLGGVIEWRVKMVTVFHEGCSEEVRVYRMDKMNQPTNASRTKGEASRRGMMEGKVS